MKTIEGNTSLNNQADGGQVMVRTRYISNIEQVFFDIKYLFN